MNTTAMTYHSSYLTLILNFGSTKLADLAAVSDQHANVLCHTVYLTLILHSYYTGKLHWSIVGLTGALTLWLPVTPALVTAVVSIVSQSYVVTVAPSLMPPTLPHLPWLYKSTMITSL